MGYCYGRNARGNMALVCDSCGQVGGVRKRTCTHTVLTDSLRSQRYLLRYCSPPALCGPCLKAKGGNAALHVGCAEGARRSQAEYDATEAKLDAGELLVISAIYADDRDWTRVTFAGRVGQSVVLVPSADYSPKERPALSDYPVTREAAA